MGQGRRLLTPTTASAVVGGRVVTALEYGDREGQALVYHFGTPSVPVFWPSLDSAVRDRGLRLICYARPGYGGSTPNPGRTILDAAVDVAALLDAVGADRYLTVGWSGGGPSALACAVAHPDRCMAAATVAGIMPYFEEEPAYNEGMTAEDLDWLSSSLQGASALRPRLLAELPELSTITAEQVADEEPDREVAEVIASSWRLAAERVDGWLEDSLASVAPWGFALDDITVPVSIWQGTLDQTVMPSHANWLAARIPGAELHFLDGADHLTVMSQSLGPILDDLMARAGLA